MIVDGDGDLSHDPRSSVHLEKIFLTTTSAIVVKFGVEMVIGQ